MPREFSRSRRVGQQLMKEIAVIIQRDLKDPRLGMPTVSSVDLSPDLKSARVYLTFLNFTEQQIKGALKILTAAKGYIRSAVGKNMKLRVIPDLNFLYDPSLIEGMRIGHLVDQSVRRDEELERQRERRERKEAPQALRQILRRRVSEEKGRAPGHGHSAS